MKTLAFEARPRPSVCMTTFALGTALLLASFALASRRILARAATLTISVIGIALMVFGTRSTTEPLNWRGVMEIAFSAACVAVAIWAVRSGSHARKVARSV
ncbi:MAG: hypothetical protein ACJ8EL_03515 [Rhizomicrobium sp.]|jgi:hypothetical protein